MKKCSKCQISKTLDNFYKDKSKKDGYYSSCRVCRRDYYQLNKEKTAKQGKQYYQDNKEKIAIRDKKYYQDNKEYFRQKSRECYLRTKHKVQERQQKKRLKILEHYGMKCTCCGESQIEFLAIDHINNDGHKKRKVMKTNIYDWIIKNRYPKDLQILCHNCNLAKAFYGGCPHNA